MGYDCMAFFEELKQENLNKLGISSHLKLFNYSKFHNYNLYWVKEFLNQYVTLESTIDNISIDVITTAIENFLDKNKEKAAFGVKSNEMREILVNFNDFFDVTSIVEKIKKLEMKKKKIKLFEKVDVVSNSSMKIRFSEDFAKFIVFSYATYHRYYGCKKSNNPMKGYIQENDDSALFEMIEKSQKNYSYNMDAKTAQKHGLNKCSYCGKTYWMTKEECVSLFSIYMIK